MCQSLVLCVRCLQYNEASTSFRCHFNVDTPHYLCPECYADSNEISCCNPDFCEQYIHAGNTKMGVALETDPTNFTCQKCSKSSDRIADYVVHLSGITAEFWGGNSNGQKQPLPLVCQNCQKSEDPECISLREFARSLKFETVKFNENLSLLLNSLKRSKLRLLNHDKLLSYLRQENNKNYQKLAYFSPEIFGQISAPIGDPTLKFCLSPDNVVIIGEMLTAVNQYLGSLVSYESHHHVMVTYMNKIIKNWTWPIPDVPDLFIQTVRSDGDGAMRARGFSPCFNILGPDIFAYKKMEATPPDTPERRWNPNIDPEVELAQKIAEKAKKESFSYRYEKFIEECKAQKISFLKKNLTAIKICLVLVFSICLVSLTVYDNFNASKLNKKEAILAEEYSKFLKNDLKTSAILGPSEVDVLAEHLRGVPRASLLVNSNIRDWYNTFTINILEFGRPYLLFVVRVENKILAGVTTQGCSTKQFEPPSWAITANLTRPQNDFILDVGLNTTYVSKLNESKYVCHPESIVCFERDLCVQANDDLELFVRVASIGTDFSLKATDRCPLNFCQIKDQSVQTLEIFALG